MLSCHLMMSQRILHISHNNVQKSTNYTIIPNFKRLKNYTIYGTKLEVYPCISMSNWQRFGELVCECIVYIHYTWPLNYYIVHWFIIQLQLR